MNVEGFDSDFGQLSERGRVRVTSEGKVVISPRAEETNQVSQEDKDKLAAMIMEESRLSWFESIRSDDDEKALILVDHIIKAGWVPADSGISKDDINFNTAKILAEPQMIIPESLRSSGTSFRLGMRRAEVIAEYNRAKVRTDSKPKKTTDDIVDVSSEISIEENAEKVKQSTDTSVEHGISKADALRIIEAHIQSDRSKKCKCGWAPTYFPGCSPLTAWNQHREHLAEMLATRRLSEDGAYL